MDHAGPVVAPGESFDAAACHAFAETRPGSRLPGQFVLLGRLPVTGSDNTDCAQTGGMVLPASRTGPRSAMR